MLKYYKNALREEILRFGYDPAKFELLDDEKETREGVEVFVVYNGSVAKLAFRLINPPTNFHRFKYSYSKFSPGEDYENSPGFNIGNWFDFDVVLKVFTNWLSTEVKAAEDESLVPDLWTQLNQKRDFLTLSLSEFQKRPFTDEEKEQIRIALRNFESLFLKHFKMGETELAAIKESLKYCADALDRLPRFDWKSLLVYTILQITTTLSLDTSRGRELWGLFQQAFDLIRNLLF